MKSWWFGLALLVGYVLTFQLWMRFPDRTAFLVIGFLAVVAMAMGLRHATRHGYFADRTDLVLHGLVIVDVALETASYEVFHQASMCVFCTPGSPNSFHNSYNFCWCAAILGLLVGGYHAWALRHAPTTMDREQRSAISGDSSTNAISASPGVIGSSATLPRPTAEP